MCNVSFCIPPIAPPPLTLAVDDALHHLLQAHHVDELAVGGRGQEVEQRRRGFRRGDLQQRLLQLLPEGQLGGRLAAGLVGDGVHPAARRTGHR